MKPVEAIERWAQGHEWLFLTLFLGREVQRKTNRASVPIGWALAGVLVVLVSAGGLAADVAVAVLAGTLTAIAPVLLWIAYALRPDQHIGEDL